MRRTPAICLESFLHIVSPSAHECARYQRSRALGHTGAEFSLEVNDVLPLNRPVQRTTGVSRRGGEWEGEGSGGVGGRPVFAAVPDDTNDGYGGMI
ncbi:hypothetical protein KIPB_014710 [Kipferlia bialata]|uniref:Uncharacterized protein n=1 Tax=Kipferlia bialata TaxID=797122 RepID=A0A9K3GQB3_9EUKA|nr:hypothetical protein KIPB_014710 [Kipferlia bialata]|eukprot:g14710.t1